MDIIVGTQIISKGFDFKNLRSVFIVDFDSWFNNADIRTNEKSFSTNSTSSGKSRKKRRNKEKYTFKP